MVGVSDRLEPWVKFADKIADIHLRISQDKKGR